MKNFLFLFISFLCFCSCEKNVTSNDYKKPENTIQTTKYEDICGVWVDSKNELYYIAIYPNGRYTYCINDQLIGSGNCTLTKNRLTLNNGYTYASDVITITKSGTQITLNGYISNNESQKINISKSFAFKKDEELSPSAAGISKTSTGGLNYYYDNLKTEITFTSDYILKYKYTGRSKSTREYKTIKEYTWHYVYRKPYTYGIKFNGGSGLVEIYDFPFVYTPNWGTLDLYLDSFRIQ